MTAVPVHVRMAVLEAARSVVCLAGDTSAACDYLGLLTNTCFELGTFALDAQEDGDQGAAVRHISDRIPEVVRRLSAAEGELSLTVMAADARAQVQP